jgi:glycosyltransferase involved in cell wall biosynthesis
MIPRVAHFVFGLTEQDEPLHPVHFMAVESCRRILEPVAIYFHYKHLPFGPYWDRLRPHLTLVEVDLVDEVLAADYSGGLVPEKYRYAHHADFVRLDALIEHGGVYADMDTIFLRPFPDDLFDEPFVIGREPPVIHERTGERRPSLCNALLMAEPGSAFARRWRERIGTELDGTWSNHSGFLAQALADEVPEHVRVEPADTFFPFPSDRAGIAQLLEEERPVPPDALSVHLWAHQWWSRERRDFTNVHAGWCTPDVLGRAHTTLGALARPWLAPPPASVPLDEGGHWQYLSCDDATGYGVAGERCRAALEESGIGVEWTPLMPGPAWGGGYQPAPWIEPRRAPHPDDVVVAHSVPEFFPIVRQWIPDATLVGHTVWETDRIPDHWVECLNAADLLIVPSELSRAAISARSTSPVAVVPHVAIQPSAGELHERATRPDDGFVFYTIAEWNERNAPFKTIECYLRAFTGRDRVVLIVKTSYRDHRAPPPAGTSVLQPGMTTWSLAQLLRHHPDPPAIRLITGPVTDSDIRRLHRGSDCFVSLCRSEGWGLGAFDAAAYGNPVVTTGFGGHLDYLGGSPWLVDFDLVPVVDPAGWPSYAPDQRWAEPDIDHGASLLRTVLAERNEALAQAAETATEIRHRYRPAAIAATFRRAVESFHQSGAARAARLPDQER